jgi:UDPglucose 6-dehydrogenase
LGATNASKDAEFHFLCLPTPANNDGSTDLSFFEAGISEIASVLQPNSIVINKSTVPLGTAKKVQEALGTDGIFVVSNPEFLSEGNAIKDFLEPSRIVIGSCSTEYSERVAGLYSNIDAPVLMSSWESAELIKHTANAYLAMKLTFVNEIATLCEITGANIEDVTAGIGHDPRIGSDYMKAGPGWGGSCFPKDSASLAQVARSFGFDFTLLEHTIDLNQKHLDRTADKIKQLVPNNSKDKRVAAWGLTFKAGTDDLRYSPSIEVLKRLEAQEYEISAYDPTVKDTLMQLPLIEVTDSPYECINDADALVILTEWDEFKQLDMEVVAQSMRSANLIDTRNLYDKNEMEKIGFTYLGMGV